MPRSGKFRWEICEHELRLHLRSPKPAVPVCFGAVISESLAGIFTIEGDWTLSWFLRVVFNALVTFTTRYYNSAASSGVFYYCLSPWMP